jgi:homoserine dehydrogenase
VITHHVPEGNFRQALAEIRQFESLTVPSVLRVV